MSFFLAAFKKMIINAISLPKSDFDFYVEDRSGVEVSGASILVLKANQIRLHANVKSEALNNLKTALNANIHIKEYKERHLISIEGLRFICIVVRVKIFPNDGAKPYTKHILPEFVAPRHQHCALNLATAQFLSTKDAVPELADSLDCQITDSDMSRLLDVFIPEADSPAAVESMLLMDDLPENVRSNIKQLAADVFEVLQLNVRRVKYFIRRKPFMLRALTELHDGYIYKPGAGIRPSTPSSSGSKHWFASLFLFFSPQPPNTPARLNLSDFSPRSLFWPRGLAP